MIRCVALNLAIEREVYRVMHARFIGGFTDVS
jgi:hypothetical protein